MPQDPSRLTPAPREGLVRDFGTALRFQRDRPAHPADDLLARIAAEWLVAHLEQCGYVVMREQPQASAPPGPAPGSPSSPAGAGR